MSKSTKIEVKLSTVQEDDAVIGDVVITRTRPKCARRISKMLYIVDVKNCQIMLHHDRGAVLADTRIAVDEIRDRLHTLKIDDAMFSVIVA